MQYKRILSATILLLGGTLHAQQSGSSAQEWKNFFGKVFDNKEPSRSTADARGWTIQRGAPTRPDLTGVCLYHDASSTRIGGWQSHIGSPAPAPCEERFMADIESRHLFFDFDSTFKWRNGRSGGDGDAYCMNPPNGYTGCTSLFFDALSIGYIKEANGGKAMNALVYSKAIEKLEAEIAADRKKKESDRYATYRGQFDNATTLEAIEVFRSNYASNDTDGLLEKLEPLRIKLAYARYQEEFANATALENMREIRDKYKDNDPDKLIPALNKRIYVLDLAEQRARAKAQKEKEIAVAKNQRREDLKGNADWIQLCQMSIDAAKRSLEREKQIEQTSGVVNLSIKRKAGETIVSCQATISQNLNKYRQSGGTKSMKEILAGEY